MSKDYKYLVYRAYSEKERPGLSANDRKVLYGWTSNKSVVKAFLEQRDPNKYILAKYTEQEVLYYLQDDLDPDLIIDYVDLRSSKDGNVYKLFITNRELRETEKGIQRYFNSLSSLSDRGSDPMTLLELYINLDEYYLNALQYLGFNPPEMDILFDNIEYRESGDYAYTIDGLIDSVYDQIYDVPHETIEHIRNIPGLEVLESVSSKILYSLESFMKIMKGDM